MKEKKIVLHIRVTPDEMQSISMNAEAAKLSQGRYLAMLNDKYANEILKAVGAKRAPSTSSTKTGEME